MTEDNYKDHLYALIVAGGGGTRLWPRSRNKTPKQFLKLFGGETLIQITTERLNRILPWDKIFVVTVSDAYKKEILNEVPQVPSRNVIVEPERKNTAPAHGLGAIYIYKKDPEAVIINAAADHLVQPEGKYTETMDAAAAYAYSGNFLVAVGIKPTYPNVGYGYTKRGKKVATSLGRNVYKLDKFTEKPKLAVVEKYVESGDYYWNANMYVWRADSFLNALKKHSPKIYERLDRISEVIDTSFEEEVLKDEYKKIEEISVDYAVSEKADNFVLLVADFRWTDIGDWKEVWGSLPKDNLGNVVIDGDEPGGEIINIDTSDALIHKDGRLIAVIDVDNIVIVDTKDALLVCSKSRAQNVKKIVEKLKEDRREELL